MQTTFIFIGIISFLILAYAIQLWGKQIKLKEIMVFNLMDGNQSFKIEESGIHSVYIIGLSSDCRISGLFASVGAPNGRQIALYQNNVRYSFIRKGVIAYQQWQFQAPDRGTYTLNFKNLEEYLANNPFIASRKPFSKRKVETKSLKVLVKQGMSTRDRLIAIIGLVLGVNGTIWGTLIAIKPTLLE